MIVVRGKRLWAPKKCLPVQENSKINLNFLKLEKFNSYIRLINVTALVLRFIDNIKKKRKKKILILVDLLWQRKELKLKIYGLDLYKSIFTN